MDPRLDKLFNEAMRWRAESAKLREVLRSCKLTEELKWGKPCYSFDGKNIAIIQRMKDNLWLMFFKGVLLKDPAGVLEAPGENSRSGRRIRFNQVKDVTRLTPVLKAYVKDAIEVASADLKVSKPAELVLVEELTQAFRRVPKLEAAFKGLTPGRQRAYNLHFSAAKQSSTRQKRIEKHAPRILSGKGLRD